MQVTVHVGMHKVATTFLQRQVFPHFREVNLAILDSTVDELFDGDGPLLISAEQIGGVPWRREGVVGRLHPTDWMQMFRDRLRRVKKVFPNAGIILGVRPHLDLIRSLYSQFLKEGGGIGVKNFFSLRGESFLSPEDLRMARRVQIILENFDDLFLYTLEDLKTRPGELYDCLLDFTGGTSIGRIGSGGKNSGLDTNLQVHAARILNRIHHWLGDHSLPTLRNSVFRAFHLTPRVISSQRLEGIGRDYVAFSEQERDRISGFYAEDWREVEEEMTRYGVNGKRSE